MAGAGSAAGIRNRAVAGKGRRPEVPASWASWATRIVRFKQDVLRIQHRLRQHRFERSQGLAGMAHVIDKSSQTSACSYS